MNLFSAFRPLAAALVLALSCAQALAADRKPDILLKAKLTEVSVSFDDAVKAEAWLLKNVTAEGTAWATRNLKELVAQRKELTDVPAEIRNMPWEMERSYSQLSLVADRYISVLRLDYSSTGGAHPNSDNDAILWDRKANRRISIRPFFTETADNGPTMTALQQAAIAAVRVAKKEKGIEDADAGDWQKSIEASLFKIGPIALEKSTIPGKSSGLMIHYPPYAVGPWAEGTFEAFIPWETLKPYLSTEGAAMFDGKKPDDESNKPK